MGENAVQAKQWFDKCYLNSAPSETTIKRWYADFKCGHTDTTDVECSGCPNSPDVPDFFVQVFKIVVYS